MKKLIIFGATDQGEVANYLFRHDSNYEPVAYTVDAAYIKKEYHNGLPVVPFEEVDRIYPPYEYDMFVALGYSQMNKIRADKCKEAKIKGYKLAGYMSSKAITWPDLLCGENCFILEMNNIQPFVKIGDNVTLWSGNHIGHHTIVGDNTFIASHVVISGRVSIGRNCFIGVNSTIRDKISVADGCLISAGSLVMGDTEPNGVYMGNPAKKVEKNSGDIII